ncbi:antirepressor regulating drug resistance protein [Desulfosporosinus acidiphilus SJ4]|uniref:Antirepressor regulating drug resistance protein n=1 Tax=Desulfosporosinus acidiphilus (strain DSM 22704 / JCM 16185 / SJ4) TaxID=646529 RepID=I4D7B6_DESAJ|nr:M56 family metallopeptidase [Desulfosporosinus acidiphilus]AFM41690.1 antirepressor regulating drug resistance protein [Desulfosporosinus acidiphilus SJ4]
MDLTGLFQHIVSLSLMGSLLSIGILLIKRLLRQKLSANWHFYIWFVLILRLFIPFSMPASSQLFNFFPNYQQASSLSQKLLPSSDQQAKATTLQDFNNTSSDLEPRITAGNETTKNSPIPILQRFNWNTAALIWLIGVVSVFFYILVINVLLLLKTKKLPRCNVEGVIKILEESKSKLKIRSNVLVAYDVTMRSPAVFGLFQPIILISPDIVEKLSSEELSYIFMHELSHLKRRDLLINGLTIVIQVVYWFNPILWLSLQQMKQDCEIACDAAVLASLEPKDHKKYGQTIISLLEFLSEPHWGPGTVGFIKRFNARRIIMISKFHKTPLKWAIAALSLSLIVGCSSLINPLNSTDNQQNQKNSAGQQTANNTTIPKISSDSADSNLIVYKNPSYGFSFNLPLDWKGYSIVDSQWQGMTFGGQSGESVVETGPMISIRDPRWTKQTPRQDIPIMVFTIDQWNSLQQGVFHIGAAPIGPSELGRNNSYVFALPARYNFAFPAGYQEVETIIKSNPLKTTETTQMHPDPTESLLANMMIMGQQGKVLFSDFPVKTTTIEDIEKLWGKADKTEYIPSASGQFATYSAHNIVFGINKGDQIFEVRSYDSRIKGITLKMAKQVLGTPAYDTQINGQEIIGYTTNSQFKVEMIFPQPTSSNPNPVIDHYNVLYPQGTVNTMANYPGRQW